MAIHHEIVFDGDIQRVFEALTNANLFGEFTGSPAEIDPAPGGECRRCGENIYGTMGGGKIRLPGRPQSDISRLQADLEQRFLQLLDGGKAPAERLIPRRESTTRSPQGKGRGS